MMTYIVTSLSNTMLVPNFLTVVAGLRPEQAGGVLLLYTALPLVVAVPAATWLLRRVDARIVALLGLTNFAIVDQIILAGMIANLCVESHLREFLEQGFEVAVVRDAVAGPKLPEGVGYLAALINYRCIANGLWTTEETVNRLRAKALRSFALNASHEQPITSRHHERRAEKRTHAPSPEHRAAMSCGSA